MDNVVYKVVFEGDILPGFGQLEVQKKLAKLFGVDTAIAARLFMDSSIEIKRDIGLSEAKNEVRSLAKIGAITYLVPYEINEDTVPNVELKNNSGAASNAPDLPHTEAFAAYFEGKEKQLQEDNAEVSHELEMQEITEPGRNTTRPRNKSFLVKSAEFDDDKTQPAPHVEITDVKKIRDLQRITRQMLAQKRPYE